MKKACPYFLALFAFCICALALDILMDLKIKNNRLMAANVMAVAQHLERHAKMSRIRYPGLKSDSGYVVAARQMNKGCGGILAFDVRERQEDAKKFISTLNMICHAVSLGATESLICIPYLMTMLYMPSERRTAFGVKVNTVRLSVGIEPADRLILDIEQALSDV